MVDQSSSRFREKVTKTICRLNREEIAILLIVQNVRRALMLVHCSCILKANQRAFTGQPDRILTEMRGLL
jgi:ABC-type branched-subunit amino acid transport system ATPase component